MSDIANDKIEAEVILKAEFYDCDPMGIVWHGNYIKYFEVARCKLLDLIGYNYGAMAESNYAWPVGSIKVKYIKPVFFGQRVRVKALLDEYENRLKIDYTVTDSETGEMLTKGTTTQYAVDMTTRTTSYTSPENLVEKIKFFRVGPSSAPPPTSRPGEA